MSSSDAGGPGSLDGWLAALTAELELGAPAYDVAGLLDVARDVAHGVARPAAPLARSGQTRRAAIPSGR